MYVHVACMSTLHVCQRACKCVFVRGLLAHYLRTTCPCARLRTQPWLYLSEMHPGTQNIQAFPSSKRLKDELSKSAPLRPPSHITTSPHLLITTAPVPGRLFSESTHLQWIYPSPSVNFRASALPFSYFAGWPGGDVGDAMQSCNLNPKP